ncbi:MAG: hypothetical protein ABI769_06435 [Pseudomonadota bacterium]
MTGRDLRLFRSRMNGTQCWTPGARGMDELIRFKLMFLDDFSDGPGALLRTAK